MSNTHQNINQKEHDKFREHNGATFVAITKDALQVYLDDTTTANVTYIGKALIGAQTSDALWQVKKIDETSGLHITYAGNGLFNQVWDNRASLTYA